MYMPLELYNRLSSVYRYKIFANHELVHIIIEFPVSAKIRLVNSGLQSPVLPAFEMFVVCCCCYLIIVVVVVVAFY